MNDLIQKLERVFEVGQSSRRAYTPGTLVMGSLDEQTDPSSYDWDGERRGGDPAFPYVIFQFTLSGWGMYCEGGVERKVLPGMAFISVVPSAHRYYLPKSALHWRFFYILIHHPYIVSRIIERKRSSDALLELAEDSMLLARAVRLFEGVCRRDYRDEFAEEQALFEFLIDYERLMHAEVYPRPIREKLFDEVRMSILHDLNSRKSIEDLAAERGMSRSHFSHHFRAITGMPPAQYILQIRLEEATRRLIHSDLKLEALAREIGFANATDLCKVFRRHFRLSPGEFRRQMRAG